MNIYLFPVEFTTFRTELLKHPDIVERVSQTAPMLQTLGEVAAILGIPVDLTLNQTELLKFMETLTELLYRRRSTTLNTVEVQTEIDKAVEEETNNGLIAIGWSDPNNTAK